MRGRWLMDRRGWFWCEGCASWFWFPRTGVHSRCGAAGARDLDPVFVTVFVKTDVRARDPVSI